MTSKHNNSFAPTSTSANLRLQSVTGHMSQSRATSFTADAVPQAPEDPLFGLMAAYRADKFEKKVDLGIGAYRDDNAKPWVLPVVKKVTGIIKVPIDSANISVGRRDPQKRSRSKSRIPPNRRPCRLYLRVCKAHSGCGLPSTEGETNLLHAKHLRHGCRASWRPLPQEILPWKFDSLFQQPNLGKPQPDLHKRPPSHCELPLFLQIHQRS